MGEFGAKNVQSHAASFHELCIRLIIHHSKSIKMRHQALQPLHEILSGLEADQLFSFSEDGGVETYLDEMYGPLIDACAQKEVDWDAVRKWWAFGQQRGSVVPINAVNLAPAPSRLVKAVNERRLQMNLNVSQQMRTRRYAGSWANLIDQTRRMVAQALNCGMKDIALVRNASEANNIINNGYRNWLVTDDVNEKENVVLWRENHPTNGEAWRMRAMWGTPPGTPAEKGLFKIKWVNRNPYEGFKDPADAFIALIDEKTRFVSFTESSNGNGIRIPRASIKKIWNHIQQHKYNCHLHIDGAMTWGSQQVDLQEIGCHSFSASAHKWFCGPKEVGILYMHPDKVENFMPPIFAYDYTIVVPDSWRDLKKTTMERFELIGQRDDPKLIALAMAQTTMNILRMDRVERRVGVLGRILKGLLEGSGWVMVAPKEAELQSIIRVKAPQGNRKQTLFDFIYDEAKIAGSGDSKTFRLSPHIYNLERDFIIAEREMRRWRAQVFQKEEEAALKA